ncbi:hypothetical protein JVU11DRAFT_9098 [Chiua virens]|nr:hypothetical protein JVU11DRAFT_9098 [Chiua virens]
MPAHNAAQDILALLKDYQITNVGIGYRKSFHVRKAAPQLLQPVDGLDPLAGPLTPTLGLHISTKARPDTQGTMGPYLAEGGDSNNLLGLSCHHVLIRSKEVIVDYICHSSVPSRDVLLLSKIAFTNFVGSIKLRIGRHGIMVKRWRKQIGEFMEREKGTNTVDVEKARAARIKDWEIFDNRVLGNILSPAISLGVGEHRFTEDWGIYQVDFVKLSDGFQGNKLDLATKLTPDEFTAKYFPRGDANWKFEYPTVFAQEMDKRQRGFLRSAGLGHRHTHEWRRRC